MPMGIFEVKSRALRARYPSHQFTPDGATPTILARSSAQPAGDQALASRWSIRELVSYRCQLIEF